MPPTSLSHQNHTDKTDNNNNNNNHNNHHAPSATSNVTSTRSDRGLVTLRYEETIAGKPPIAVTVPPPFAPPMDTHPALRRQSSCADSAKDQTWKRDSGLAPTTSSKAREGSVNTADPIEEERAPEKGAPAGLVIDFDANRVISVKSPMQSPVQDSPCSNSSRWNRRLTKSSSNKRSSTATAEKRTTPGAGEYVPLTETVPIPTDKLLEEDFLQSLSFSKRGSIMLSGKKAVDGQARPRRQPSHSMLLPPTVRILSADVERESQKVRSMYEQGPILDWDVGAQHGITEQFYAAQAHHPAETLEAPEAPKASSRLSPVNGSIARPESAMSFRQEHELAGGIEDWEDVDGNDVDRYGFIGTRRKTSRPGTPEPRPPQRVSTALQSASETPRKRRTFGRTTSTATRGTAHQRAPSRKVSKRSLKTMSSAASQRSTSRIRSAANRLPGNQDRRCVDEAGDMLTLPPGLADIAEDADGGKAAELLKQKEWERTEKWRRMAKMVKTGKDGQGMAFEFDTSNSKLIQRTWKGIPDRWRAAAWHSFLSSSAKKRKCGQTDEQIILAFHSLLDQSSADDLQIDLDVPRTINSHIMFRKRYRGGQRLLFRVLHCLSLYFPETGYVQGMASLAATLLCYYDEEMTFVMLTRMWTLRGLDKLYEPGFAGLMTALDEFRDHWLKGSVSEKLNEMNIEATAYGTRWYLTLFNYSIPFPAQLRVWDVFMLLGDPDPSVTPTTKSPFAGGLDIVHAVSAALIDGTRDILLDSDFENTMKVLTSWIPVKDEELLMRVTRAEWKLHRGKKR